MSLFIKNIYNKFIIIDEILLKKAKYQIHHPLPSS